MEYEIAPSCARWPSRDDVILDSAGMVWYSGFADELLGKLDPKTGEAAEYPIPLMKPGFPTGSLELHFDKDENVWLSLMYQGGIAEFDRKAQKFQEFSLPKELQKNYTRESMVMPNYSNVEGKVWTNNQDDHSILRLTDLTTGTNENLGTFPIPGAGVRSLRIRHPGRPQETISIFFTLVQTTSGGLRRKRNNSQSVSNSHTQFTAAQRHGRRARPFVVRRIWRKCGWNVRLQDREDPEMESFDILVKACLIRLYWTRTGWSGPVRCLRTASSG